jgi:hypothetical protein
VIRIALYRRNLYVTGCHAWGCCHPTGWCDDPYPFPSPGEHDAYWRALHEGWVAAMRAYVLSGDALEHMLPQTDQAQ